MAPPRRPDPDPLELDDVRIITGLTGLWVVALAVLGVLDLAGTSIRGWWMLMCLAGIALGLIGVRHSQRRRAAIARAATSPGPQPA